MDELTIGGKTYISSKRAAEITGYAKDYVGQLCREGQVEARMVGRSWYVLESSIREHRFGKEEVIEESKESENKPSYVRSSWTEATYEAERAPVIPELTERVSVNVFEMEREELPAQTATDDDSAALSDMQAAWREWFNQKQELERSEPEAPKEAPYTPQEQLEDDVVPVSLQRIEEPEMAVKEEEEPVVIHRSYNSMPLDVKVEEVPEEEYLVSGDYEEVVAHKAVPVGKRQPSSLALRAVFVSLAGVAAAIAFIGSGYAGVNANFGISSPILDYLQGETSYHKIK